eukprot:6197266-Amphidinium_carterae.1
MVSLISVRVAPRWYLSLPGSTLATTGDTDLLGARATVTTLMAGSGGSSALPPSANHPRAQI